MPKVKKQKTERISVGLPKPMVDEIDRIVKNFTFYGNRQQFVETAIKEKIEKVKSIEAGVQFASE